MPMQPKLTICVPSRNRQATFKLTIASLLASLRTDVEFVFADNSDDASIMQTFMMDVLSDPRVKFLPTGDRIYPMNDNWERCVEAATGEYICIIGDDDYVDPDVTDLLHSLCASEKSVDVFVWSRLNYNWPDNRARHCSVAVPLKSGIHKIKREHLFQEFFSWQYHTATPNCPFSIYHGAVAKRVMDANKARFGGRHFGHLTVDFETSCKLLVNAETFYYSERPFSILGACFASNSGTVGNPRELKIRHAQIMAELGRNMDEDPYMQGFPFGCILGIAAAVGQVQQWFCVTYGITRPQGWERNFVEACIKDCEGAKSQEFFDLMVAGYSEAFSRFRDGKLLKHFLPVYRPEVSVNMFRGISGDMLYIDETVADVVTPADLYRVIDRILKAPADLSLPQPKRKAA